MIREETPGSHSLGGRVDRKAREEWVRQLADLGKAEPSPPKVIELVYDWPTDCFVRREEEGEWMAEPNTPTDDNNELHRIKVEFTDDQLSALGRLLGQVPNSQENWADYKALPQAIKGYIG